MPEKKLRVITECEHCGGAELEEVVFNDICHQPDPNGLCLHFSGLGIKCLACGHILIGNMKPLSVNSVHPEDLAMSKAIMEGMKKGQANG